MAQIPTSNISMSAIDTEVNTLATANNGLKQLHTDSIAYTGGNATAVTNNTKADPDSIREFAGYTHTQNFPASTTVRYYDSNLATQSFTSSSNPYAANQTTVSSSTSNITSYTQSTSTDSFFVEAKAGVDFRVRRNSSYLYLEWRHAGVGITYVRYNYREGGQIQSVSSSQVGGGGTGQGQTFNPLMRIQTGINPGGLEVAIIGGASTTTSSGASGGAGEIQSYSGATAVGGNHSTYGYGTYHTLNTNNHSVGVRFLSRAYSSTVQSSFFNFDATKIYKVFIRASGYYDQEIASIMPRGYASCRVVADSCPLCCIHDSMHIWTKNDNKSIYEIEIGDEVVSHNFETGKDELVEVTDKVIVERDVNYSVNSLILTEDHPIYLEGGRKASINPDATKLNYNQEVDELKLGDMMIGNRSDGTQLQEVTEIQKYEGTHNNYALQTKHNNFYAGGILVDSVINRGES